MSHERRMEQLRAAMRLPGNFQKKLQIFCRELDIRVPDVGQTLVLNANNDLVQYLLANKDGEHSDMFCKQLYDLAMISHQPLQADKMTEFINRSNEIMMLLTK